MSENYPVSGKEIKIAYFYINCFSYEFPSNSAHLLCSKKGFLVMYYPVSLWEHLWGSFSGLCSYSECKRP